MFDIMEKSTFLLEIITLLSLVNKMVSDKVFIVGDRSFYIMKSKGPKIDPRELNVLIFPILRKTSQMILFQFFVFYLSDRI
jgi:hypothetical protein